MSLESEFLQIKSGRESIERMIIKVKFVGFIDWLVLVLQCMYVCVIVMD